MDTRQSIKKQFMELYTKKDFASISVKELCAAVPVARTTFYSYYRNTDEVRCEIEDILVDGLKEVSDRVSEGNLTNMDFTIFMDAIEVYIRAHWQPIYAFLVNQPNARFIRKWKDAIKQNFSQRYPALTTVRNYDAVAEILAATMLNAYTYWMEHADVCRIDDIKPLIKNTLDALVVNLNTL